MVLSKDTAVFASRTFLVVLEDHFDNPDMVEHTLAALLNVIHSVSKPDARVLAISVLSLCMRTIKSYISSVDILMQVCGCLAALAQLKVVPASCTRKFIGGVESCIIAFPQHATLVTLACIAVAVQIGRAHV